MGLLFVLSVSSSFALFQNCGQSDLALLTAQAHICKSGMNPGCGPAWSNITAEGDWPNQAVYTHEILEIIAATDTCLNTSVAGKVVEWLNMQQSDPTKSGSIMDTWDVFQVESCPSKSICHLIPTI
jgi:hypothetical protein